MGLVLFLCAVFVLFHFPAHHFTSCSPSCVCVCVRACVRACVCVFTVGKSSITVLVDANVAVVCAVVDSSG